MEAVTPAIIVTPAAEQDIAAAISWYGSIHPALSLDFRLALEATFRRITHYPDSCEHTLRGMRRALLDRFPYGVFYRHYEQAIQIIAVLHTSRDPHLWQSRTQ